MSTLLELVSPRGCARLGAERAQPAAWRTRYVVSRERPTVDARQGRDLDAVPDIHVRADLECVLRRPLSKDPAQRQANALELAADLRGVLKADPNEQIRSLARRWNERGRSPDLLARGRTLMELKRSVQSLRATLHRARTTGRAAQNRDNHPDFAAHVRGKIAYIAMIDPVCGVALDALPP